MCASSSAKPESIRSLNDPVHQLASALNERTGIKVTEQVLSKLERVFEALPTTVVSGWIKQLEALPGDHYEWLSLIENLTVHETSFFRDRNQLKFLEETIIPELLDRLQQAGGKIIRIWVAGCATGEEVYTYSMLLVTELIKRNLAQFDATSDHIIFRAGWGLEILGSDISRPVLVRAERGHYLEFPGLSPFRNLPERHRTWFKEATASDEVEQSSVTAIYAVHTALKKLCRFKQHNLMHPMSRDEDLFDLVSCRNVLIYFTPEAKQQVLSHLSQRIKPAHHLILGPTDPAPHRFESIWGDQAVVYRKPA
ncbi:CheR family methyltransferase [Magnetococcus sp. PR-3]|uniref:CheR family methyltransferase n=1 Tax=Magnetococcus sp. PR-3 TaxID=3120355 RepID=UPI002FCE0C34